MGSVRDEIERVLKESSKPLDYDEIMERVEINASRQGVRQSMRSLINKWRTVVRDEKISYSYRYRYVGNNEIECGED